ATVGGVAGDLGARDDRGAAGSSDVLGVTPVVAVSVRDDDDIGREFVERDRGVRVLGNERIDDDLELTAAVAGGRFDAKLDPAVTEVAESHLLPLTSRL